MPTPLTRVELDLALASLAARLPVMQEDMDSFFETFESHALQLEDSTTAEDREYLERRLQEIVDATGINDAFK
jgi:hypothetical protein